MKRRYGTWLAVLATVVGVGAFLAMLLIYGGE